MTITARAAVVKAAPGRYQMCTILTGLVPFNNAKLRLSKQDKQDKQERKDKLRSYHRDRYLAGKAERARLYQFIESVPDNDRELWNRPDPYMYGS